MIFFRRAKEYDFEARINSAVFPALQGTNKRQRRPQRVGVLWALWRSGGPHNNVIAAVATQLKEVMTPEFVAYSKQSTCLQRSLVAHGSVLGSRCQCSCAGSRARVQGLQARHGRHRQPPHPVGPAPAWPHGQQDGGNLRRFQVCCRAEAFALIFRAPRSMTLNKNSVFGDKSALTPGGVRVGAPALTSRGFKETDFEVRTAP
jgi:glycine hydroxymethyltransferase